MENGNNKSVEAIKLLIDKSANAERSEDAMRFSQAACNAANALIGLKSGTEV